MSYGSPYGTAAPAPAHSHDEVDDVRRDVEELQGKVRDLEDYEQEVRSKLGDHDFGQMAEDVSDHESELRDALGLIKRLTARVAWLEGVVTRAELAPSADLSFTAEDRRLAALAAKGRAASRVLLSEDARAAKRYLIDLVQEAAADNAQAMREAAVAARILAETPTADPEHTRAAAQYAAARARIASTAVTVNNNAERRDEALAELAADDASRTARAAAVAKGAKATATLATRLRTRLVEQLGAHALMPPWFADRLGPAAPSRSPEAWFEAATALLVYRCSFDVIHPLLALGAEPSYRDADRWAMYQQAHTQLRAAAKLG